MFLFSVFLIFLSRECGISAKKHILNDFSLKYTLTLRSIQQHVFVSYWVVFRWPFVILHRFVYFCRLLPMHWAPLMPQNLDKKFVFSRLNFCFKSKLTQMLSNYWRKKYFHSLKWYSNYFRFNWTDDARCKQYSITIAAQLQKRSNREWRKKHTTQIIISKQRSMLVKLLLSR